MLLSFLPPGGAARVGVPPHVAVAAARGALPGGRPGRDTGVLPSRVLRPRLEGRVLRPRGRDRGGIEEDNQEHGDGGEGRRCQRCRYSLIGSDRMPCCKGTNASGIESQKKGEKLAAWWRYLAVHAAVYK